MPFLTSEKYRGSWPSVTEENGRLVSLLEQVAPERANGKSWKPPFLSSKYRPSNGVVTSLILGKGLRRGKWDAYLDDRHLTYYVRVGVPESHQILDLTRLGTDGLANSSDCES